MSRTEAEIAPLSSPEDDQAEVIALLGDPGTYGRACHSVEVHATHGSIVFLAGDRAFKLKRTVRYDYMDYSTSALRESVCKAELAVNRRTAPDLYLAVRPILRHSSGALHLGIEGDAGTAIDWVVVMRRFPQSDLLEERRKCGTLDVTLMRNLAGTIAHFHSAAEICPQWGGSAGIARVIEENVRMFRQFEGRPFEAATIATYAQRSGASLSVLSNTLEARRSAGRVRRCHGDLHLNNVCVIGGRPVLFDAIEFNDDFSCIDVYFDLAFLLMDLHHHRLDSLANALFNRYLQVSNDLDLGPLPLFLSCRAAIRAHVAAASAGDLDHNLRTDRLQQASSLLDLSIALMNPQRAELVAIGGFSGTGKSTLAISLAPFVGRVPGAVVLRSDVIRKRIFGVDETEHLQQDSYSEEANRHVYDELVKSAAALLEAGQSVIADAVFGKNSERSAMREAATRCGVEFRGLWLEAPPDVLTRRVSTRAGDASDATSEIVRRQLETLDRPTDWGVLDASGTPDTVAATARRMLWRRLAGTVAGN